MEDKLNISSFKNIGLDDMPKEMLMDRVDTKFICNINQLSKVLSNVKDDYFAVVYNEGPINNYKSRYFDTNDFNYFLDHHNKRNHRHKVRFREYVDSGIGFLEVKEKVNGRTIKKRIQVNEMEELLSDNSREFISTVIPEFEQKLSSSLNNKFQRITLVSNDMKERVTIDFDLSFWKESSDKLDINDLAVIELKQGRINRSSSIYKVLRSQGIRPCRFSKYAIGLAYLNDGIKYNRFKKILLQLEKITKVN